MWIEGYVHVTEDEAFLANVHMVSNIDFYAGNIVGYMELSDSDEYVKVKRHPAGTYNGQIIKEV